MPSASEIKAGAAYVELYLKDNRLTRGLLGAKKQLQALGAGFQRIGGRTLALGAGIVAPLIAAGKNFAATGDELDKMSARVGASVEFLSALSHAAQIGGTDLGAMETGIRRLQRSAYDADRGLSTAQEAFEALGVSVKGADGQLKSTEDLFMETASAISSLENNTQKAAIATVVFGRAGTSLLPMLKKGADGLVGVMEEAKRLGIVMSTEDASAAAQLTDQMTRLSSVLKRGVFAVGAALAGDLGGLAERLTQWAKRAAEVIRQNQGLIQTALKIGALVAGVGAGIIALGTVLSGLGTIAGVIAGAITMVGTVIGTLGAALAAVLSPIGLVTAALVAGGLALAHYSGAGQAALDWLGERFSALWERASGALEAIRDALAAGDLQLAARVLWAYLRTEWERGTAFLEGKWLEMKHALLNAWTELAYDLRTTMANAVAALESLWVKFSSKVQDIWSRAQEGIAKGFAYALAEWEGLDPEQVARNVGEDFERRRGARRGEQERRLAEIEQERSGKLSELSAERLGALQRHATGKQADLAKAEADLAQAQAELDALKIEARKKAADAALATESLAKHPELGPQAAEVEALQTGVLGTFSGYAASLLGGRRGPEERIAAATAETARNTAELNKRARLNQTLWS